ncbi:hypothetical protein CDD82_937 [Ophiocordyceps australis]|uniref:Mitochondrial carrier protein n=1 Tax=Ophiocordyceps australis TaxID=1399860 RepID=A0A2C5ZJZ4_9HYPO|nr:hypothetical protein CDD82_937 [Ophiocordyceps australis]
MPGAESGSNGRRQNVPGRASTYMSTTQVRHWIDSKIRLYRTEIAAGSSTVISTLVCFPLDSIKTRMQTNTNYHGVIDCVKQTYRSEKLAGFFRGSAAPMASITVVRTVSFSVYQRARDFYSGCIKQRFGFDVQQHLDRPGKYPNLYTIACFGAAGASAGSAISVVACPFELSKLSAQVSDLLEERAGKCEKARTVAMSYRNKGTFRLMENIVRHRGFLGLYTGFRLHLLRDTLGTAIYFMVYESGKQLGTTLSGENPHSSKVSVVVAGGLCGMVSWALTYPIDSAKSIYQRNALLRSRGEKVQPPPKIDFFKRQMYRGLGVSMSRSCALNALFFPIFEFMKKRIVDERASSL